MSTLKHFNDSGFDSEVLAAEKPVLVDFYADWCTPCKMVGPVVERLAEEYGERILVGKLDVDTSPDIAIRYGIRSIPTLGVFQDGRLLDRLVGFPGPPGVRKWLENTLEKAGTPA